MTCREKQKQWKKWTFEEEERLLDLYRDGATFHQIALKLGRSKNSVANKFQCFPREKFFRPQKSIWDAETDAVLLDLAKECNLDFVTVGKKLGRKSKLCMNRYIALQKGERK